MSTVLVVDDDRQIRTLLRLVLQNNGWRVAEAVDGRKALDWFLDGERADIVLLDLMMPEMDGFQFLAERDQLPLVAEVPVVVMTAMELSGEEKSDLKRHALDVLSKGPQLFVGLLDQLKVWVG